MNRGPTLFGCDIMYDSRAWTGHRGELLRKRWMEVPCLNGSVLDAFMYIVMDVGRLNVISWKQSVVDGSNFRTCDAVYSETRRKPWKAVSIAAHSMALSCSAVVEFNRFRPSWVSNNGVIGIRGGFLNLDPCERLMPRMTRYRRLCGDMSGS